MNQQDNSANPGKECWTFMVIADCGSFLAASEVLFISQPALLKQINHLEAQLGFSVFTRTNRGVTLTPSGRIFYDGLERIRSSYTALLTECRKNAGADNNTLRVGYLKSDFSRSLYSVQLVSQYQKKWPDDEIILKGVPMDQFLEPLLNGEIDVISCFESSQMRRMDLHFHVLADYPCHCLLAQSSPLAGKTSINVEDLHGQSIFLPQSGLFYATDQVAVTLTQAGIAFEERIYEKTTPVEAILSHSVMISFGNIYEYPGGVTIPLNFPVHARFGIACRQLISPAAGRFLDLAAQTFRQSDINKEETVTGE